MKKIKFNMLKIFLVLTGITFSSCCFKPEDAKQELNLEGYELVWKDEFDASSLDSDYWTHEVIAAGKSHNNEVQAYTNSKTNCDVDKTEETLKITATSSNGTTWDSSRINTSGKVSIKYGYIEARLKMPVAYDSKGNKISNTGVWPAFWMMPENVLDEEGNLTGGGVYGIWPNSGEIDIMEYSPGTSGQKTYATLHHATSKTDATDVYPSLGGTTFEDPYEWHTYGLFWTSGTIEAFYDGVSLGSVYANPGNNWAKWPYDQNFYIILNLAMGGKLGGGINGDMRKAVYEIDYVRVYQNENCSISFGGK